MQCSQNEQMELELQFKQLQDLENEIDRKIAEASIVSGESPTIPSETDQSGQKRKLNSPRRQLSANMDSKARVFETRGPEVATEAVMIRPVKSSGVVVSNGDLAGRTKKIFLDFLECRNLPREDYSGISCLLQAGDQLFKTISFRSGLFPEGSATCMLALQDDDEISMTIIDSNRPILDNVIGNVIISAEALIGSHGRQDVEEVSQLAEILELPICRFDGTQVVEPSSSLPSVLIVRCRAGVGSEVDESLRGTTTGKGSRPAPLSQQTISNKISVFDGVEDLTGQRFYLKIVSARHLTHRSRTAQFCNPYCKVRVGDIRFETSKCMGTVDPDWSSDVFELEVVSRKDQLHIQVVDWDMLERDRVIGSVKVPVSQVLRDTMDGNRKTSTGSKATSSSSVAWAKQISSSSAYNRNSNSSVSFNKNASSSSAISETSDDAASKAGFKLFDAAGLEVRSAEGATAYVVLRLSPEPFCDEPAEESEKQAWDVNGLIKVDRQQANQLQRSSAPPPAAPLATPVLPNTEAHEVVSDQGTSVAQGDILVSVIGCTGLAACRPRGLKSSLPFCSLQLGHQVVTTPVGRDRDNPYFGHECSFASKNDGIEMKAAVKTWDNDKEIVLGL